jgi:hypothetical protein
LLKRRFLVIGVFSFLATIQQSKAGSDYLVVENVDRLRVYNKYQQEASAKDLQSFVPFVPMKILKANDMLGDGFTPCMQVELDGQIFYLLKDKDAGLSQSGSLGFNKTFSNTTILLDTVRILTDRSIKFSPINSSSQQLSIEERALRIFRHQNATYCRLLNTPARYGWIDFGGRREGKDWKVIRNIVAAKSLISSIVIQKIRARINEVNSVLTNLFTFFNTQTHQQKRTPRWNIEASRKIILCTLEGARKDEFEQSTFYLVNDLENIVLGSEFEVTRASGRIEIRQK